MAQASTEIAGAGLPRVSHGRGSYVWDSDGRQYIDGSGGPAVYALGYGHPEVVAAVTDQLARVMHGYRYTFTSDPLEELTGLLRAASGMDEMVFCSGGSEAVEGALKIALQYHTAQGRTTRRHVISRQRSWHGNTMGALAVSGFRERRAPFEPALPPQTFVSPANAFRPPAGVAADDLVPFLAAELEAAILRLGPDMVAAFIFEPVVGAAGGCVPAPPGYAAAIRAICDRHDVVLIADEVMCGSGRTGTFRALEQDGVMPDIMPIAKGLAAGYVPLGATLYTDRIAQVIAEGHGGPMTGHTFTGHTTACAAGLAVQKVIARDGVLPRVLSRGPVLMADLRARLADVPEVGDVRGRGYFIGLELVADPATKAPFPHEVQLWARVRQAAFDAGLICYPSGGNVDGWNGDTIILAPPYNASDDELDEIADKLNRAIRAALRQIGRAR
jgi:adenosylmethionine-8-amino-7-oxononanoate aminotransferase